MKVIVIPKHIKRVQLSKSRRKKYYHTSASFKNKKGIRESVRKGIYKWKIIGEKPYLVDENQELIVANPLSYGTPKLAKINGQDSLFTKHLLGNIKKKMKDFFYPYFKDLVIEKEDLPIKIRYEIHDTIRDSQLWDVDNRTSIYRKVLQDLINTKMPGDDNNLCVPSYEVNYVPIEDEEERMMIIEITKDDRKCLDKEFYINERNKFLNKKI